MKLNKALASLLIACASISLFSTDSSAQYGSGFNNYKSGKKNKYFFKGLTLNYYYTLPFTVEAKHQFAGYNSSGSLVKERSYYNKVDATPIGYGAITTYFPLYYTGERSMFALDLGLEYNGYSAKVYNLKADDSYTYDAEYSQGSAGLMVGISYKYGSLASYAMQDRFSWYAGIAAVPTMSMMSYNGTSTGNKFHVMPMLHAGIGLYAGIQWTLQAKYYPLGYGNEMVIGSNSPGMDNFPTTSRFAFKTRDIFQVGVGVNLFSIKWDKFRW